MEKMSILIKEEISITRQEGDDSIVEFVIPDIIPILPSTLVIFQVKQNSRIIFTKSTLDDISIEEQKLIVDLSPSDTKGKAGSFNWELQATESTIYGTLTLAKGKFNIVKELIV